jgi:hypothetical protein
MSDARVYRSLQQEFLAEELFEDDWGYPGTPVWRQVRIPPP